MNLIGVCGPVKKMAVSQCHLLTSCCVILSSKGIWRLEVGVEVECSEKIACFIRMVKHGRLLTNYRKHMMHFGEPFCKFFKDTPETTYL
jgi:hypothetical protein